MNNLMDKWCEGFKKHYPGVTSAVEGKGSGTAMPALENGTATFGCMSRDPSAAEITAFQKKFGYKPVAVKSSLDMLAVFVHKDNPIKGLSFVQIDAIFSSTRKRGGKEVIEKWGQLGLTEEWAKEPIALYGRDSSSGTYTFFKEHVLEKGDFKDTVKVQSGSSGVISAVAGDKFAIGYSGIGYATADVRAVPLVKDDSGDFVAAEPQNAYSGKYPLWRPLLLVVNRDPTKDLDPLRREFIKYVLSKEGQAEVVKSGFLPLPAKAVKLALADAGIK
jgi:phosphate transport system substrate-binding protein